MRFGRDGRLVFDLYGAEAPLKTARFVDFVQGTIGQFKSSGEGPSYAASGLDKLQPGALGGCVDGAPLPIIMLSR